MPKVLMEISMSVDGYVVSGDVSCESPMGRGGERLRDWMFAGKSTAESGALKRPISAESGR
jgi:hypothetical protein